MKIDWPSYMTPKHRLKKKTDFKAQEYSVLVSKKEELLKQIQESKEKIKESVDVEQTLVVGMGGSSLGVKAFSYLQGVQNLSFLDELNDYKAKKVISSLNLEKTVFLVISKSGNTSETLVLLEHLLQLLNDKGLQPKKHIHIITVSKNSSALLDLSKKTEINTFEFPKELSGRFSMFGFPGLLPLALSGLDLNKVYEGFLRALNDHKALDSLSAALIESIENKDFGQNYWTYDGRLTYFRAWLRQLISESLGKNSKDFPNYSLPPFIECRGSTDQHSYLQHVLALPKRSLNFVFETEIDANQGLLDLRQKKEAQKLKGYFSKYEIRYVEVRLKSSSVESVSQFFATWMFVTQSVGDHYGLDVFKQENIDELKRLDLS